MGRGSWCEVEKPTPNTRFVIPKDPIPLIFRCADGVFIHLVIGAAGSKYKMYQALEIDDPSVSPNDSGMPTPTSDPKNFYGNIDLLAAHAAKKSSTELLERIWALGLPAEPVLAPGMCWDEPQVQHNGIIATDADGTRHVGHPMKTSASPAPYKEPRKAANPRPLDGVRVVDFGAFVAGPFASVVLADLGADIIKVETPAGDPNRSMYRWYTVANRGKRAITIDLKNPEGQALARDLCASADIVTNNFRSGVSARLGIDVASLHALKPELIVLESPGYGSSGPLADRAAFDMVMQAFCGHEHRGGGEGNEPLWNRTSMVDFTGGFLGAVGTLAALYYRTRHGDGATIDCPLVNAGIALLSDLVQWPDGRFEGGAPLNPTRTGYRPAEALYQATDGWIALAVRGRKAAAALATALGLDGRLDPDPLQWGAQEAAAVGAAIGAQACASAIATLEAAGVWVELCRRDGDQALLNDPALQAANTVQVSTHPQFGEVRELGAMVRFSRSSAGHRRHAPLRGESTRELLAELGRSASDIDALAERKIVA
ncbi:CaiB/BaiF CoA-transferase family protein [Massilia cavernae]|uniref:CoA transferase n=1 Tax=Massilia cavernae TaxID=2320864 RepID=A0A418X744_9BURK|nr:CoA transferase [Massilia cavernae]RJG08287.1 CoA transferase [Massilia cavernae]